ncbi:putative Ig domain-containing protein [Candidatus Sumerlaeota bacterium]|nr:putative Ig domain-containing protein [Candidatus Sumerlaeota bacterium]
MSLISPLSISADVTYTLHLDGVDSGIASQISASMAEAVALYNQYGSFNKSLNVYYNSGVPTAQASYNGTIEFGGSRNTRVALHEILHTMGTGTYWAYGNLMTGGTWDGAYANARLSEFDGAGSILHGDSVHFWPYGLNYDTEDSFLARYRSVRMMAALRCDMGILSYIEEPESQVVPEGGTAEFYAPAVGASSYAWYRTDSGTALADGGDISGAETDTLRIENMELADEGYYYCVASGLSSRPAHLMMQRYVSHWGFDGDATDSISSNDGVATGSPSYVTGVDGQAIDLDGSGDYVTLPDGFADAVDLTVAAWIYWDGGSDWQRVFDFGNGTNQYMLLTPSSSSDTLCFAIKNGGSKQYVETSQLATAQWVHVAVTLHDDVATLYVNGASVDSGAMTISPIDFQPTINLIGDSQYSADPLFNGRIDDFRFYNYALTDALIDAIYNDDGSNIAPDFYDDPIARPNVIPGVTYSDTLAGEAVDPDAGDTLTYSKQSGADWLSIAADGSLSGTPDISDIGSNSFTVRATDGSGAYAEATLIINVEAEGMRAQYLFESNCNDSIGSYHGTATGAPAYSAGYSGEAINLDASDDYVTLPAGVATLTDMTIMTWVYWNGGSQWQRIFDFGNDTTQYMFLTPCSDDNTLRFGITDGVSEQTVETSQLASGEWVHVAVTLEEDLAMIYVNGVAVGYNSAVTIDPFNFTPSVNYIGKSQFPADPLFDGSLDDFRIYNYALTGAEINDLIGESNRIKTIARWRFEDGVAGHPVTGTSGGTAYALGVTDVSGNGNHLCAYNETASGWNYSSLRPPVVSGANTLSVQNIGSWPSLFTWSAESAPSLDLETVVFSEWTIEAFIYPTTITGQNRGIVGRDGARPSGSSSPLYFNIQSSGALLCEYSDLAGNVHLASTATGFITTGNWYYVAVTCNGSNLTLYSANLTDGDTVATQAAQTAIVSDNPSFGAYPHSSPEGPPTPRTAWSVGRQFYSGGDVDRFIGNIDEVRISCVALDISTESLLAVGLIEPNDDDDKEPVTTSVTSNWMLY